MAGTWRGDERGGLDLSDPGRGDRRKQFELGGQRNRVLDLQTVRRATSRMVTCGLIAPLLGQGGEFLGGHAE